MFESSDSPWLRRYACFTALATLVLLGIGGLVTSHNAGMAVPDWPNSYGYNMFLFPMSKWVGGILYEHTHRLVASFVGVLVVGLTRWLGGRSARLPLAMVGLGEMLVGGIFLRMGSEWKGAGYFLTGIAGVVLLGAVVWVRNEASSKPLPLLGWIAFVAVQVQGLLGGLRVVLFKDEIGIFHAMLAQLFFALLCVIALLTTKWWQQFSLRNLETVKTVEGASPGLITSLKRGVNEKVLQAALSNNEASVSKGVNESGLKLAWLVGLLTLLILGQLILGAAMRHQHAGLSIPDFPLAYGKIWPAVDSASVELYNQKRVEVTAVNPITAAQIELQMVHRVMAVMILAGVASAAWLSRRNLGSYSTIRKMTLGWLMLILTQAILGAATIWSGKAADVATAHFLVGALSLAAGGVITLISWRAVSVTVGAMRTPRPTTSTSVPKTFGEGGEGIALA